MTSAREYCEQALALISAGRHDDARVLLTLAAELSPVGEVRAEIIAATAWVMAETGDLAGGMQQCRRELLDHDAGRQDLTVFGRAIVVGRIAALDVRAGNDDAALPLFNHAVDALEQRPAARGRVLINRSYIHLRRRALAAAARDLDAAEADFAAVGDTVEQAKVVHNRGYVDLLAGDLPGALDRMNSARIILRGLSPAHQAICDIDRAEVLEAAGMVGDATDALEQVLQTLEKASQWHTKAEAQLLLARIVVESDGDRAARLAHAAAEQFRDNGSEVLAVRADAITARVRLATATDEAAFAEAARVVRQLNAAHLGTHAAELKIHTALRALELDGPRAAGQIGDDLDTGPLAPVPTRLLAAQFFTARDRARGNPVGALTHAAVMIDEFVDWQTHFGTLSLQVASQRGVRELMLQALQAAWETGDSEQFLAWSERARGAAAAWNPVRAPRDENVVAALAEIRALRDVDGDDSFQRRLQLQERVRDLGWRGASSAATRRAPSTIEEASDALAGAGADLVTFLWLGDRLVAMTLTAAGPRLHDLGPWAEFDRVLRGLPADLDLAAAQLAPVLRSSVARSLRQRLEIIDRALIGPLRSNLTRSRVVITAPGVLGGIPWALLPSLAGLSLSAAVSVGWWIGSANAPARARPTVVATLAGPGTTHGEREAREVATAWSSGSECVVGSEASTAAAARLAERATVLHVSAHGGISREHPLFSSVQLADGPWFGHDIEQLESVPDLVVASSCEIGRAVGEHDTLGMVRAWLHAGATCVIAAPSNIDDELAADLFPALHRGIADGATPGDALALVVQNQLGLPVLCYGNAW